MNLPSSLKTQSSIASSNSPNNQTIVTYVIDLFFIASLSDKISSNMLQDMLSHISLCMQNFILEKFPEIPEWFEEVLLLLFFPLERVRKP